MYLVRLFVIVNSPTKISFCEILYLQYIVCEDKFYIWGLRYCVAQILVKSILIDNDLTT